MKVLVTLLTLVSALLPRSRTEAHALEPGYLEIMPLPGGDWQMVWRIPQVAGRPMPIEAVLPEGCAPQRPPPPRFDGRAFVAAWQATCTPDPSKGSLRIDGLSRTATDVLVRYQPAPDVSSVTLRLTPDKPEAQLPSNPTPWSVTQSYFGLGVEHILGGIDHLFFVFALLLLIRNTRRLIGAVTAFTVAHSFTLAVSALGWVILPMPPVEAVIALSIAFLANEILLADTGQTPLTVQSPWAVTFAFGLLHGLGFASALREIGLPEADIPLALLSFNMGVEAGQLAFIAVVLLFGFFARRVGFFSGALRLHLRRVAAYGIGGIAALWTIERVGGFFA
jgi:hydrogenase/urease accessory protein HupE